MDTPANGQAIASPMTVSGRSSAYEGNVEIRVVQVSGTTVRLLGSGHVTGGGMVMAPFSGQVRFTTPTASTGWVIFLESSALNGDVTRATVVPVTFAGVPAVPAVQSVQLNPNLTIDNGWLLLPDGSGQITLTIRTTATAKVQVYLTTSGTASPGALLGQADRGGTTFSYGWRYTDQPILGYLTIVATGPGGRTEFIPYHVYHS